MIILKSVYLSFASWDAMLKENSEQEGGKKFAWLSTLSRVAQSDSIYAFLVKDLLRFF
jgi:hypothetical protein